MGMRQAVISIVKAGIVNHFQLPSRSSDEREVLRTDRVHFSLLFLGLLIPFLTVLSLFPDRKMGEKPGSIVEKKGNLLQKQNVTYWIHPLLVPAAGKHLGSSKVAISSSDTYTTYWVEDDEKRLLSFEDSRAVGNACRSGEMGSRRFSFQCLNKKVPGLEEHPFFTRPPPLQRA